MEIEKHLAELAQADPQARRAALEAVLAAEGLTPELQEQEADERHKAARNYLLYTADKDAKGPLLCAHYDAHPGSTGANDNAAGVCILIALAKELQQRKIPATIAFFDGEESGHSGAKLFEEGRTREVSCVVNLDMCGYGDTIAVYARGSENRAGARPFCAKERLAAHHAELVKYMPEGDNVCFTTRRQPVVSLAVMPKWDTKYLTAMAAQGMGLLGRTPEFKAMLGEMEVSSTMHGGFRDAVKWVQPEAMQMLYDYLLDSVTTPPPAKKLFGIF